MPLSKHRFIASGDAVSQRLDHALFEWLLPLSPQPGFSRAKLRSLILAGSVYINGVRTLVPARTLTAGARIEVFVDWKKIFASAPASGVFSPSDLQVLFEDEYLIAVLKPPGLPTQPTVDPTRDNLFQLLKKKLVAETGNPDAYVGLHHRLDRDTSGVVVFTKQTVANAGIAESFSRHLAQKTYLAFTPLRTGQKVQNQWGVKNHLGKLPKRPGESKSAPSRYGEVRSGGDFAQTDFVLKQRYEEGALWSCQPKTGRTHQIRVHLSESGMPIAGDDLYGVVGPRKSGSQKPAPRLLLHALRLELNHPITGQPLLIEAELPQDFRSYLNQLRPLQPSSKGTSRQK